MPVSETIVWEKRVHTPEETAAIAELFVREHLAPGDVIALKGDLGSGKTFFSKAVCRTLETNEASSPTFTIVNVYENADGLTVYHFDFYRIEHPAELLNLGLDDYFYGDGICLIEWPEKLGDLLPPKHYRIDFEPDSNNPNARTIRLFEIAPEK